VEKERLVSQTDDSQQPHPAASIIDRSMHASRKTYATMRRTVTAAAAAADDDTPVWLSLWFMVATDEDGTRPPALCFTAAVVGGILPLLGMPGGLTTDSGTTQWLATASSKSSPDVVVEVVLLLLLLPSSFARRAPPLGLFLPIPRL